MCETMNYIFGSLHESEIHIKKMDRAIRMQAKENKRIKLWMLLATVEFYVILCSLNNKRKEIKKLNGELEMLKNTREEE